MSTVNLPRSAPPDYMAAPARIGAPYGLLSVVIDRDSPSRWAAGVEWEPIGCGPGGAIPVLCTYDLDAGVPVWGDQQDGQTGVGPRVTGLPIETVGFYDCSTASRPLSEARERAIAHLLATEERQLEYQLATGVAGGEPSFQGADVLTSGPTDIESAVSLVESAIATRYGGIGVIHAPRRLGAYADAVASRRGERIETLAGNYVVLGGGYDAVDVDPDGDPVAEGSVWIYGTSRPLHWQDPEPRVLPDPDQVPDRATNDVLLVASRLHLVAWECVTVAAEVQVGPAAGGDV